MGRDALAGGLVELGAPTPAHWSQYHWIGIELEKGNETSGISVESMLGTCA